VEATFRTRAVRRDSRVFYDAGAATPAWAVVGNTAQALLDRDFGLVQHCEARAEGVAVTWVLPRPLPGAGPLTVNVELSGLTYAGRTKDGQHFADGTGTARLRVGNVRTVDSAGRRWEVTTHGERNGLRVEVPETTLAQATYPLAIDPVISPEFGMDNPVPVPASGLTPAVAGNGTDYLVVWKNLDNEVYGARVTRDGMVADPWGFAICAGTNSPDAPAVASNGGDYLVVWQDFRDRSSTNIYGARVTSAGVVLDTNGTAICLAANDQTQPAAAARGSDYLVAWEDRRGSTSSDIYGARVSSAGMVADPEGIAISTGPYDHLAPAAAGNGTNWLVVWHSLRPGGAFSYSGDIYGARVTSAGVVSDVNGIAISTQPAEPGQLSPAVGSSGTHYFVVWQDYRHGYDNADIYGARVTSAGGVSDAAGIPISTAADSQYYPTVAFNGTTYLVGWWDQRNGSGANGYKKDFYATRVTVGGTVFNPSGIPISTNLISGVDSPKVTASGTNFFALWRGGGVVYGARLSSTGTVQGTNGIPITFGPNAQWRPAVAFNGSNYLVVWEDERHTTMTLDDTHLYGTRVTRAGTVLDPSGIDIGPAVARGTPAVAASGHDFLVVWEGGNDAFGSLVTGAGVVGVRNVPITTTAYNAQVPATVAGNGNGWLVVWTDGRNLASRPDIYGARVSTAGVVADPAGIALCTLDGQQHSPAVAASGSDYLAVWQDKRLATNVDNLEVFGTRVSGEGVVLDPSGLRNSRSNRSASIPAVAGNGSDYFVVWQDVRPAGAGPGMYGARISRDGTVADPDGIAIKTGLPYEQLLPAVAATDREYLAVWMDTRHSLFGGIYDVYGARVGRDGQVLDPGGVPIALPHGGIYAYPRVASDGVGQFLVVSLSQRPSIPRVIGNFVGSSLVLRGLTTSDGAVTLWWDAVPGVMYRVQYKADLRDATWTHLPGDVIASGPTGNKVDETFGNAPRRFYRVVAL
jgi:hypothetical protein